LLAAADGPCAEPPPAQTLRGEAVTPDAREALGGRSLQEAALDALLDSVEDVLADVEKLRTAGALNLAWVTLSGVRRRVELMRRSSALPAGSVKQTLGLLNQAASFLLGGAGPLPSCTGRRLLYKLATEALVAARDFRDQGLTSDALMALYCARNALQDAGGDEWLPLGIKLRAELTALSMELEGEAPAMSTSFLDGRASELVLVDATGNPLFLCPSIRRSAVEVLLPTLRRLVDAFWVVSPRLGTLRLELAKSRNAAKRQRSLFPLPLMPRAFLGPSMFSGVEMLVVSDYADTVVTILNDLAGFRPPFGLPARAGSPWILWVRAWTRVWDLIANQLLGLAAAGLEPYNAAAVYASLHAASAAVYADFDASRIDLLPEAAQLDPCPSMDPRLRNLACDPTELFPAGVGPGVSAIPRIKAGEVEQYDLFVAGGLSSGKFVAVRNAKAGGSFFCIEKKGGARLRAIWNGQDISSRTLPSPLPPELLTPECLGKMDFDVCPRLSKLDGQVLFDQLRVPPALSPFLCGPSTTLRRLAKAGADPNLLSALRAQGWKRDDKLYPGSNVWPMGFSWASWAAQSHTVALRAAAALHPSSVLAQDRPVPSGESAVSGVATDDIVVLTSGTSFAASRDVLSFKRASSIYGMRRNEPKDVVWLARA